MLRWLTLVAGFLVFVVAACGGSGDGSNGEGTASGDTTAPIESGPTDGAASESEIQVVYSQYFDELRAGDGEAACELLTDEYQQQVTVEASGADCPAAVEAFADLYGDYRPQLRDIAISGDSATATDPGDDSQGLSAQEVKFERVDDEWKIADAGMTG